MTVRGADEEEQGAASPTQTRAPESSRLLGTDETRVLQRTDEVAWTARLKRARG